MMKSLLKKITNYTKGGVSMMINFYAMQILQGWITLEQVPRKFRAKVAKLIEESQVGLDETEDSHGQN